MIERKGHIKQTILWLEGRKQQLSDEIIEVELCVDTLMQLMDYDIEAAETEKRSPRPADRPAKKIKKSSKMLSDSNVRKGKKSKYKGVSPMKPLKSGKIKYQAFCWDGKKKKCVTIGTYDTELMAAAAYQDHVGNKAEARKLRDQARQQADMAEQAENNRDRPPTKKKGKKIWVCKRCGLEYRTDPTKHGCIKCQHKDFREVSGGE